MREQKATSEAHIPSEGWGDCSALLTEREYNCEALARGYAHIPEEETPLLTESIRRWSELPIEDKPLRGKRILFNTHLTSITLMQIHLCIAGGAQVYVMARNPLIIHGPEMGEEADAVTPLKNANIVYLGRGFDEEIVADPASAGALAIPAMASRSDEIIRTFLTKHIDLALDCGAGLQHPFRLTEDQEVCLLPSIGFVELTFTRPSLYKTRSEGGVRPDDQALTKPVIDADKASSKISETMHGTGDGLVRALIEHYGKKVIEDIETLRGSEHHSDMRRIEAIKNVAMHLDYKSLLNRGMTYVLFGFGKVGKGIANRLEKAHVARKDVIVVEVNFDSSQEAIASGHTAIFIDSDTPFRETLLDRLKTTQVNCVITATGVDSLLSRHGFRPTDFTDATLVNMGTDNEFGDNFPASSILNNGLPVNFSLPQPTKYWFLDPYFTLLELLLARLNETPEVFSAGLIHPPVEDDRRISQRWAMSNLARSHDYTAEYEKIAEQLAKAANVMKIPSPASDKGSLGSFSGHARLKPSEPPGSGIFSARKKAAVRDESMAPRSAVNLAHCTLVASVVLALTGLLIIVRNVIMKPNTEGLQLLLNISTALLCFGSAIFILSYGAGQDPLPKNVPNEETPSMSMAI